MDAITLDEICTLLEQDTEIKWSILTKPITIPSESQYKVEHVDCELRGWKTGVGNFCPLTAAHYLRTGEYIAPTNVMEAADYLGFPINGEDSLVNRIIEIADNNLTTDARQPARLAYAAMWNRIQQACKVANRD